MECQDRYCTESGFGDEKSNSKRLQGLKSNDEECTIGFRHASYADKSTACLRRLQTSSQTTLGPASSVFESLPALPPHLPVPPRSSLPRIKHHASTHSDKHLIQFTRPMPHSPHPSSNNLYYTRPAQETKPNHCEWICSEVESQGLLQVC